MDILLEKEGKSWAKEGLIVIREILPFSWRRQR
jgi:hypothetical protein